MNNGQQPCTCDDLKATLESYKSWLIAKDGRPQDRSDRSKTCGADDEIIEYTWQNCGRLLCTKSQVQPHETIEGWASSSRPPEGEELA